MTSCSRASRHRRRNFPATLGVVRRTLAAAVLLALVAASAAGAHGDEVHNAKDGIGYEWISYLAIGGFACYLGYLFLGRLRRR